RPEHMSYLLAEADHPYEPWAVLTGDSLFVSSAGRPDLLGEKHTKQLAEQQFHTLRDFYLKLPDHVMIYPNHGAGSPCGADIGARLSSTIGYERKFNKFLQFSDAKSFSDYAIKTAPPVPHYYPIMKKVNAEGPRVIGNLPRVPTLPPKAFKEAIEKKAGILVDVRNMLAFGGGHVAGARHIFLPELGKRMSELDRNKPTAVYCGSGYRASIATSILKTQGFNELWNVPGSWEAWKKAKLPIEGADGE